MINTRFNYRTTHSVVCTINNLVLARIFHFLDIFIEDDLFYGYFSLTMTTYMAGKLLLSLFVDRDFLRTVGKWN